jgi:hypothetical protein
MKTQIIGKYSYLVLAMMILNLACKSPDKKLIILQDVQSAPPSNPLELIYIADAINEVDFLSLDDIVEVNMYSKTNLRELLNTMGLGVNETADNFKHSMSGLAGSRYHVSKKSLFGHKYHAVLADTFNIGDDYSKYNFVLYVKTGCTIPNRFSVEKVPQIRENWYIVNLKSLDTYELNLPKIPLPEQKNKKTFRSEYIKEIRAFIENGVTSEHFKKVDKETSKTIENEFKTIFQ